MHRNLLGEGSSVGGSVGGRMHYGSIYGGKETAKRIIQIKKRSREFMLK